MKKYRITYQPFGGSDMTASDVIIPATDEADAERKFEQHYPNFFFVSAKEEM